MMRKSMKFKYFLILVLIIINKTQSQQSSIPVNTKNNLEEFSMVDVLRELSYQGDPSVYYHWNEKLAILYQSQISKVAPEQKLISWFKYCQQLLKAGKNQRCIDEIEDLLLRQNLSYKDIINNDLLPVAELLALAYLRLGEVTNCLNNHNSYSCILPLNDQALHVDDFVICI